MQVQDLALCKTLSPAFSLLHLSSLTPFSNTLIQTLILKPHKPPKPLSVISFSQNPNPPFSSQNPSFLRDVRPFAGRSKKKPGNPLPGRIEGNSEYRKELKRNARRKSQKLAESLFYRLKNPNRNHADNFSEDELQQIGLGYDRMVRFMEKNDPNIRHPYDWYKYGEFGPYSWRGIVVGDPIRGRFSDERVTIISEVRDEEEWEKIEQAEMTSEFGERLQQMDESKGFRYFWVFVRHPKWKLSEKPWQQWTLVSEVVVEAEKKERLDKWNLMGRLGNKTRKMITQCAAWMRPDIIYVKRPVYQCRFEPQDDFFKPIMPFLDPNTEQDFLFELKNDDGRVDLVTYFGGLCKIVKVNPKSFVDDVVNAYEKLSDENKSECLEFLLKNHPVQLLHPYTKEWKAKLEEEELGCDAPDDDDDDHINNVGETEITDWIETDDEEEVVMDMEENGEDNEEENLDSEPEENEKFWEEEFQKAVSSSDAMEQLVKKSVEASTKYYKKQMREMEGIGGKEEGNVREDGDEREMRGKRAKVSAEEWKYVGYGPWRKRIKKSRIPPELFLRAAVRPFTYRNLVKEIVLTRHAILDGEIGSKS